HGPCRRTAAVGRHRTCDKRPDGYCTTPEKLHCRTPALSPCTPVTVCGAQFTCSLDNEKPQNRTGRHLDAPFTICLRRGNQPVAATPAFSSTMPQRIAITVISTSLLMPSLSKMR